MRFLRKAGWKRVGRLGKKGDDLVLFALAIIFDWFTVFTYGDATVSTNDGNCDRRCQREITNDLGYKGGCTDNI